MVPFQNGLPLPSFEKQDRGVINLAGTWKKERQIMNHDLTLASRTPDTVAAVEKESQGRYQADFNDSAWQDMAIPGVENPSPDRYQDGAWYRRTFTVGKDNQGKFLRLVFLAANYFTDVWINGKWLGCHEGGYTPFAFDISSLVNYDQKNTIAVRVDNIPWVP